jgi:hypothetical protein
MLPVIINPRTPVSASTVNIKTNSLRIRMVDQDSRGNEFSVF